MKKKLLVIGVAVLVFAYIAYALVDNKKVLDSRREIKTTEQNIAVSIAEAGMKSVQGGLNFLGTTEPLKEVTVAAEASGKITKINFKLGDFVSKGSVLAEVDASYRQLAFDNAKIAHSKFKEDYARFQNLRKGEAVTETQLRDMRVGFENAEIALEQARKQLEDTKILAPFSGYITTKNTELGAYVNPGVPICGIADINQLKVTFTVSESNVYQLSKGQKIAVTTDIYPDAVFNGTISNISPKGNSGHTYPVEVIIANNKRDAQLKAGTYVDINVETLNNSAKNSKRNINSSENKSEVLMIPRDAIISSIKEPSVYILEGDKVRLAKLNIGRNQVDGYLEVVSGLNSGDKVVVSGQINLTDGAKVLVMQQ